MLALIAVKSPQTWSLTKNKQKSDLKKALFAKLFCLVKTAYLKQKQVLGFKTNKII
jgi:hypothetical protein